MRSGEDPRAPEPSVPLAPFSTLQVGGPARWFVRASTIDAVVEAHRWSRERGVPLVVLGGGSNLVIADAGLDALVLRIAIRGADLAGDEEAILRAGAGADWDDVVALAVSRGFAGLECLSGIPGSVGGTPVQNVGAYGQEVAETIDEVVAFDREAGTLRTLRGPDCHFAYRMSRFKQEDAGRYVICGVSYRLRRGPATASYPDVLRHLEKHGVRSPGVADVRKAVLAVRRGKGMVLDPADPDTRSVGSFFMNPVVPAEVHARLLAGSNAAPVPAFPVSAGQVKIPAAWLIEKAGFSRGFRAGRAAISSKHTLAIVNLGGAAAGEIVALAAAIKRAVADRFGIWLRPEPVFLGFGDDPDVEYLQKPGG